MGSGCVGKGGRTGTLTGAWGGRMPASREAVPLFSLWKPLALVCLLPSKHVNCTLLKMWQWHQPLGWPLTIGNTYSPGLHFRYELWTSIALSAWRARSPQARLQCPDACVSPPLWSQPAAPGLGPNSSWTKELLPWKFLTGESRNLRPDSLPPAGETIASHVSGKPDCSCSEKSRDKQAKI